MSSSHVFRRTDHTSFGRALRTDGAAVARPTFAIRVHSSAADMPTGREAGFERFERETLTLADRVVGNTPLYAYALVSRLIRHSPRDLDHHHGLRPRAAFSYCPDTRRSAIACRSCTPASVSLRPDRGRSWMPPPTSAKIRPSKSASTFVGRWTGRITAADVREATGNSRHLHDRRP